MVVLALEIFMKLLENIRRGFFIICFSLLLTPIQAQVIKVFNATTKLPITDVYIVNAERTIAAFSKKNGTIDLSEFPAASQLVVQHPNYEKVQISLEDLINTTSISLQEKVLEFDEMVVSANKWEQDERKVPNDIIAISAETSQFQNPQTAADLLANSGQVFVQKSQLGGGSPKLRGFSANAVLLVVDGVRLNNAIFRSGNLQNVINIDPNILERTEVVFGPGSVMYGSDALGGVMDFHTKSPNWAAEEETKISANAMLRYGTAANERTGHFDITLAQDDIVYFGSFSRTLFGDLRAGNNRSKGYEGFFERTHFVRRIEGEDRLIENDDPNVQRFTGYHLTSLLQKVKWRTSENTQLTYGFYYSTTSDIPRYDRLTIPLTVGTDSLEYAEWYYGPQTWQMHNISFSDFQETNWYDQMRVTISYQRYDESRHDRRFGDDRLRNRKEQVDVITFNHDFDKSLKNGTLYYGVDAFWNGVDSRAQRQDLVTGEITPTSTRYPSEGSVYWSGALYGNYQWDLSPEWVLSTGARYNLVRLTGRTANEELSALLDENEGAGLVVNRSATVDMFEQADVTNQAVTGSIGVTFNPSKNTKLSGLVSSGFRSPNVDDVGKLFELDDETIVVPNPDLKPEYSYNQEIGWEQYVNELISFNIVGYHSFLTNAIVRGASSVAGNEQLFFDGEQLAIRSQVNASGARLYGGSASIKMDLSNHWSFSSTINMNEGKETETDEPLRHATPIFGRSSVKYKKGGFRSEFFVDYNGSRNRSDIPAGEIVDKPHLYTNDGTPGWATLNLRFGYTPSKSITVESGLENILDQHYRPYTSGISAPGRNFYFSLKGSL